MKKPLKRWGSPVELSALPVEGTEAPWTVLAYEATLLSYRAGGTARTVALTRSIFDACVANFGRYPKVPVVIEHADTRGGPSEWAQPQGWVTALRVGSMERGGKTVATLEGKLSLGAEMRAKVVGAGADAPPTWPFGSVTIVDALDEETGKDLGAALWSFSLTAHPRLADVPRLAASHEATEASYYGPLESRDDVLAMIREVLRLPVTATESEVNAQLVKLGDLAAQEPVPEAACEAIEDFGEALRLPVLATPTEVLAAVRRALDTMPGSAPATMAAQISAERTRMKNFLEMAAALKLSVASEDAAHAAVLALAQDGAAARAALNLGAEAPLAPAVAEGVAARAELAKVRPELEKLQGEAAERAKADRVAYVGDVCLARGWDADVQHAMVLAAHADFPAFQAKYPRPSREELAQRAQDPARLAVVAAGQKTEAGKQPEPVKKLTLAQETDALRGVYAQHGFDLSVTEAAMLVQRGETPDTAAAKLAGGAPKETR
jgi:hypothetical protein